MVSKYFLHMQSFRIVSTHFSNIYKKKFCRCRRRSPFTNKTIVYHVVTFKIIVYKTKFSFKHFLQD